MKVTVYGSHLCPDTLYAINQDARLNHVFEATPGVLAEECATMISTFFANKRKK